MLERQGKIRADEQDRMLQILTTLGKEVEDKRVGRQPNQEEFNPEWTEDESGPVATLPAAPWQQVQRRGSKSSPTQRKEVQQPHHQPQQDPQEELQRQQQQRQKQQQAEKERQKKAEQAGLLTGGLTRQFLTGPGIIGGPEGGPR